MKRSDLLELSISTQRIDKVYNIRNSPEYVLGKGNFGIVIKAEEKLTGQLRAIKIINKKRLESIDADLGLLANEFEILRTLDHPNVLRLYEVYEDQRYFYFVMEYLEGRSLYDRFIEEEHKLTEENNREVFLQLIRGIQYLHKNGIAHRDIKPENIIFLNKENNQLKIVDFGVSKYFYSPKDPNKELTLRTQTGSLYYMAPEIIDGAYDAKCDLWSAGVILYAMFAGEPPIYDTDTKVVVKKILNIEYDFAGEVWKNVSPDLINLIQNLLIRRDQRLNAEQILEHPWLASGGNDKMLVFEAQKLKKFFLGKTLCRYILEIIAADSSQTDNEHFGEFFVDIDEDGDGLITREDLIDEIQKHLDRFDGQLPELIMQTYATNQQLNYNNFISALNAVSNYSNSEKRVEKAFRRIDVTNSGKISGGDLKLALKRARAQEFRDDAYWNTIVAEVDSQGKGYLDLNDLQVLMKHYLN